MSNNLLRSLVDLSAQLQSIHREAKDAGNESVAFALREAQLHIGDAIAATVPDRTAATEAAS